MAKYKVTLDVVLATTVETESSDKAAMIAYTDASQSRCAVTGWHVTTVGTVYAELEKE